MTGALFGCLMFILALVVGIAYGERLERRRFSCDGCRQEALGSSMPFLRHTCSKSRALYEDRRGNVFTFRRPARWQSRAQR